eukprot:TRINITY_DN94040_c0_g1_i1.p2 TRINITY_DN94040_c0_g1~~TRINITY_DN94040_c0_g1_i1.p2  ORF type:complete len:148 (-),score=10.74 TRINITY_DN94040_c0_g1_i1:1124-1567(-)
MPTFKLLPPKLFGLCVGGMVGLHYFVPVSYVVSTVVGGAVVLATGLFMCFREANRFKNTNTNIKTYNKPTRLVIDGLFKYTRNPMYLGFTTALCGVWLMMGSLTSLFPVVLFWLTANFHYIPYEEALMQEGFGEEYSQYCQKVRRWI